jgi:hypothetical protein
VVVRRLPGVPGGFAKVTKSEALLSLISGSGSEPVATALTKPPPVADCRWIATDAFWPTASGVVAVQYVSTEYWQVAPVNT